MPQDDSSSSTAQLTPLEARVIGCLMEKQRTTPDQYPLTLNGLVSACNQKTARHPVMHLTQGEVGNTVNRLRDRGLVHESSNGRTERYDHKMVGTYFLSREEQAVLCVLLLRGPQTLGELRVNCARMADFTDLEGVAKTVQGLSGHERALVTELPRLPGKREERYAHLLCGHPEPEAQDAPAPNRQTSRTTHAEDRVAALEAEVATLRDELDRLWELTGFSDQR
ncbi:UPF0502 protein yceH [Thiorhodococcus drewsii AZ1]|uniref:UPF0502 protein yceH n=1 Tax=Thiorhodococcus drewsii AZ1 TaxID=765913 RepID=G2DZK5_9GAMM|nr:YceH family protein [Thiorhodococcus drewsii]EGV32232.1 UPF0502 protein yceH [Thiorhodococcus drewsii AZ1]